MANILTGFRIICSVALLFVPAYSVRFYLLYIAAGISDMLDGFAARKLNTSSKFGAIFDSVADCMLVGACMFKLIPLYDIPIWLYVLIAVIVMIKLLNIILGFAIYKTIVAEHTVMNKAVGILLFIFPLICSLIPFRSGAFVLCVLAGIAAIQELCYIKKGKFIY